MSCAHAQMVSSLEPLVAFGYTLPAPTCLPDVLIHPALALKRSRMLVLAGFTSHSCATHRGKSPFSFI
jgi:hypothetical protein